MKFVVHPELPTASVGSSQAPTAAVDNSAPLPTRPQSTYKSGKAVQTNGATSDVRALLARCDMEQVLDIKLSRIIGRADNLEVWLPA